MTPVPTSTSFGRGTQTSGPARVRTGSWLVVKEEGLPNSFLEHLDTRFTGVHRRLGAANARGADPQYTGPLLAAVEPAEAVDPLVVIVRGCRHGGGIVRERRYPGYHPGRQGDFRKHRQPTFEVTGHGPSR